MTKPFDATLSSLIAAGPADWVAFLAPRVGLAPGPAEPVDTDLSVTAQADNAFRLAGPPPAVLHIESQSSSRRGIPGDLLRYNVLLGHNREEAVYSVVVLLRPAAAASDLTGVFTRPNLEFRYAVVRVWEETVAGMLAAPTTAPLALLTNEAVADPDAATDRFGARLRGPDVDGRLRKELGSAAFFLSGLRYDRNQAKAIQRRLNMILEDSVTYQWVVAEGRALGIAQGRVEAAQDNILLLAGERFGPAPAAAEAAVRAVADPDRLKRLTLRVLTAAGWDDLLATS